MTLSFNILFAVAAGGALGAVSRFLIQHMMSVWLGMTFPWGTLVVNVLGCLCIGLLSGYWLSHDFALTIQLRAFLAIGFLGAFTTFSAFSLDTMLLFHNGEMLRASLNVVGNLILCLMAVVIGYALTSR